MTTPLRHIDNLEKELELMYEQNHICKPDLLIAYGEFRKELQTFKKVFESQIKQESEYE